MAQSKAGLHNPETRLTTVRKWKERVGARLTLLFLFALMPFASGVSIVPGNFEAVLPMEKFGESGSENDVLVRINLITSGSASSKSCSGMLIQGSRSQPFSGVFQKSVADGGGVVWRFEIPTASGSQLLPASPVMLEYFPGFTPESERLEVFFSNTPTARISALKAWTQSASENASGAHVFAFSSTSARNSVSNLSAAASALKVSGGTLGRINGEILDYEKRLIAHSGSLFTLGLQKDPLRGNLVLLTGGTVGPYLAYKDYFLQTGTVSASVAAAQSRRDQIKTEAMALLLPALSGFSVGTVKLDFSDFPKGSEEAAWNLVSGFTGYVRGLEVSAGSLQSAVWGEKMGVLRGELEFFARPLPSDESDLEEWGNRMSEFWSRAGIGELDSMAPEGVTLDYNYYWNLWIAVKPAMDAILSADEQYLARVRELDSYDPEKWFPANGNPAWNNGGWRSHLESVAKARADLLAKEKEIELAQGVERSLRLGLDWAKGQRAAAEQSLSRLEGNPSLLDFRGYGWSHVLVMGTSTAKVARAVLVGRAPDGQAWTFSGNLRVSGGTAVSATLNARAMSGTAPRQRLVSGVLRSSIARVSDASGPVLPGLECLSWSWNGLEALPKHVSNLARFVPVPGKNFMNQTSSTPVILEVGERDVFPLVWGGFGASVTVTNTVASPLTAARTGSALSIVLPSAAGLLRETPSPVLPSFSGKFVAASGGAIRSFSGVLGMNESDEAQGLGCLTISSATNSAVAVRSVPVTLKKKSVQPGERSPELVSVGTFRAWRGVASSRVRVQLDAPAVPHLTVAKLIQNGRDLAVAEADADGAVFFDLSKITVAGSLTLSVQRTYASGNRPEVSQRTASLTLLNTASRNFQTLLGYSSIGGSLLSVQEPGSAGSLAYAPSPDGNPFRGRVSVTSAAAGAFSGNLEWVDLLPVTDERGGAAPLVDPVPGEYPASGPYKMFVPVLRTQPFTGRFAPVAGDVPDRLSATLSLPSGVQGRTHRVDLSLEAVSLQNSILATGSLAGQLMEGVPLLRVQLGLVGQEVSGGTVASVEGMAFPAVSSISAARNSYRTFSEQFASRTLADQVTWNYSGASTVGYVWKSPLGSVTGTAQLRMDGVIPMLLFPTVIPNNAGTLSVPSASIGGPSMTTRLTRILSGFAEVQLQKRTGAGYQIVPRSLLFVSGAVLEANTASKSGYRWNSGWGAGIPVGGFGGKPGGLLLSAAWLPAVPYANLGQPAVEAGASYELRADFGGEDLFDGPVPVVFTAAGLPEGGLDSVLKILKVYPRTGNFTVSMRPAGLSADIAAPGYSIVDSQGNFSAPGSVVARGVSSDGRLVWTLSRQ